LAALAAKFEFTNAVVFELFKDFGNSFISKASGVHGSLDEKLGAPVCVRSQHIEQLSPTLTFIIEITKN
jgi:hypothetical protein